MEPRPASTLTGAALTLAIVVALFIGGGLSIRALISRAFDNTTASRDVLALARRSLVAQLDEETGVRGYAVTGDRTFLEPYDRGVEVLPGLLMRLQSELQALGLPAARAAAGDASTTNAAWLRMIATPVAGDRATLNDRATALAGKSLVDRFRSDIDGIMAEVADRQQADQTNVRVAIDRINLLIATAAVIIALVGAIFLEIQRRATLRIERERVRAERERRAAQALRAAYDAEKRIADSLQEAIAQRPLPTLPALSFSATYVPATDETKVGGDWYDALELRDDRVLFVIGDVTGHGIDAAVAMNRARQAIVSAALLEDDPAAVLARVNQEMCRQNAPLVTALVGFADAGTYEFVYSTAGHPPPLLIEPGRVPRLLACGSLPLGALAGARYRVHRIQSVPGATLVLYTDGATEHSRNVIEGEELLIAAAAGAAERHAEERASFIHEAIFTGRPVGDDVAILTVTFAAGATSAAHDSAGDARSRFAGRLGRVPSGPSPLRQSGRRVTPAQRWVS